MKKNAFSILLCLLFALTGQAQTQVIVTGHVTSVAGGGPVANHQVFCYTGDSLQNSYGDAITGADGAYSISLTLSPGFNDVYVSTLTFCDPANPFVSITANVVNGQATADFQVCNDTFPPLPDCFADMYFTLTDTLTFQFTGYYYSLFDSTVVAAAYLWDFGDGATSTEESPVHTYAQDGFYVVSLTVTGADGCVATIQYPFETSFNGFPDCMGYIMYNQTDTTTFDFSASVFDANGNILQAGSYNWDFGDGATSTEVTPTHTYAVQGVYTVQLHAITEDSCEIHACDVVFAFNCPVDTFWYGCQAMFATGIGGMIDPNGNPVGGDPLSVSFIDLSLGGVVSWAWDFGDGSTSTEQNPVHTYTAAGTYTVSLHITTVDGCESETAFEICVGDNCWEPEFDCQALFIPIPDSLGGNGIQFLDLSVTNAPIQAWTWNFGDGATSTEQNPFHVYGQPGVYTVSLTIEADSCYSVISFDIDTEHPWNFNSNGNPGKLGVSANTLATHQAASAFDSARVFPNPAQQELTLAFNSKVAGAYALRVTDMAGKTVMSDSREATTGVNSSRMNVSVLLPGIYLVEIRSGDSVQTMKFVKQ